MFQPLSPDEISSATTATDNADADWNIISPVPGNVEFQVPPHHLGEPSDLRKYRDSEGNLLFAVARFDQPNDKKEFRPLTYGEDEKGQRWEWRGYPSPRPLYNLDQIIARPDASVVVCEGEKSADAAASLLPEFVGTTSPNGSGSAHHANWLPLKGRAVLIWPDADKSGNEYAADVARLCREAGAKEIRIIAPPQEAEAGWDAADAENEPWCGYEDLIDTAKPYEFAADAAVAAGGEPPRPLFRELPPPDPFPLDALGYVLGNAARAIHDKVQAPEAMCAQSVLAASTLAVQGYANVVLPTGQEKPISSFFLTIGVTGERKTATDIHALWPVRKYEKYLREKYDADLPEYLNALDAWKKQRQEVLKNNTDYPDTAAKKAGLDALGGKPQPPLIPLLTPSDPTFEGLAKLFARGQPSLGLFSAEGGQFIGGHGMSEEPKLRTAAGISSLWDGEPIKRVRAGDGVSILPGRRLAIHLMAQPDVAAVLLGDRVLEDQGMLSRLLVSSPNSTIGTRKWRDPKPESDPDIKRYGARLLFILERPLPLEDGKTNELAPRRLELSPEATSGWIAFSDHIEGEMTGGLEPIRGLANKLPEHAARLAAVLTLVEDIKAGEIPPEHMVAGIELAQYYATEALRLFAAGYIDPDILLAQRTLKFLECEWREEFVSLRVLYTHGPNAIRDRKTAKRIAKILADHGWLDSVTESVIVDGHRTKDAWRVIRSVS
jgi:hypothetical protein